MRYRCLVLVATAACSATEPGPPPQLSALPRALSANEERVANASNAFTFDLFRRLVAAQPDSNVFVSPLSVTFSLGMSMNGAAGSTLDEMRSTLRFAGATIEEIDDGYRSLMSLQRGLDPSTTFQIANSVWYRQGLSVKQPFVDAVKQSFDAEVRASPFDQTTVAQVNDWVNTKTNGKIPKIIDAIDDVDVMFLINAIYFKGSWRERFDPARTQLSDFQALGGAQQVKVMSRDEAQMPMGFSDSYAIADLVYGNSAFVMTVLLPLPGAGVNALAATLDTASWNHAVGGMHDVKAIVQLPKLRLEYERELKGDLQALGMRVPFVDGAANFSNMSAAPLFIGFVQHRTFVDVNEEGTEAAAVTHTGIQVTSGPPCLCVDRPYIFAIRERFSGTILFIGRIVRIP